MKVVGLVESVESGLQAMDLLSEAGLDRIELILYHIQFIGCVIAIEYCDRCVP